MRVFCKTHFLSVISLNQVIYCSLGTPLWAKTEANFVFSVRDWIIETYKLNSFSDVLHIDQHDKIIAEPHNFSVCFYKCSLEFNRGSNSYKCCIV